MEELSKNDAKAFLKRLREKLRRSGSKLPLRYYLAGEYGPQTFRPHYHAIIFNVNDTELILDAWKIDNELIGHIDFEPVNDARLAYVTGYIMKIDPNIDYELRKLQKPFSLMSKGLGKTYLNDSIQAYHKKSGAFFVTLEGGKKQVLPRYYKEKIFTDGQRSAFAKSIMDKVSERVLSERERIKALGNNDIGKYQLEQRMQYIDNHIKKTKQQKL